MGRLQKKKKTGGKKKKNTTVDSASPRVNGGEARGANLSATPPKETRKRSLTTGNKGPRKPAVTGKKKKNYLDVASQFLREVIIELKKVTWPSRKQTTGSTVVMIILVAIISLFLGMVDMGLYRLVQIVLQ